MSFVSGVGAHEDINIKIHPLHELGILDGRTEKYISDDTRLPQVLKTYNAVRALLSLLLLSRNKRNEICFSSLPFNQQSRMGRCRGGMKKEFPVKSEY